MSAKVLPVSIPEETLKDLNEFCTNDSKNRSKFVVELIKKAIYGDKKEK